MLIQVWRFLTILILLNVWKFLQILIAIPIRAWQTRAIVADIADSDTDTCSIGKSCQYHLPIPILIYFVIRVLSDIDTDTYPKILAHTDFDTGPKTHADTNTDTNTAWQYRYTVSVLVDVFVSVQHFLPISLNRMCIEHEGFQRVLSSSIDLSIITIIEGGYLNFAY